MIRYDLKCADGHGFDAWFKSSDAFEEQRAAGQVHCAVCGSGVVEKAIMAPAVGVRRAAEPVPELTAPASPETAALAKLRRAVEETSDYVGKDFAVEARRIHDGDAEQRAIWGEASLRDAAELRADGVPVAPLPWMRRRDD